MKNEYKDYLKGERNKGKERGKIKQGRDRRERKEEKWGEREVKESDSPWTHSKVTDNVTSLSSFCSHDHFIIALFLSTWQMIHTYFRFRIL